MPSLFIEFVICLHCDCVVDSCSHWVAVHAWPTNAEHLWRPQDEQIWQPGINMQVCINITLLNSIHPPSSNTVFITLSIRQRSAVLEVEDPSNKHSLLHQWLQWIGTVLQNTAHLQRYCQRDRTVPVLLQRPESRRWQDFSIGLCVCSRYNSIQPPFAVFLKCYRHWIGYWLGITTLWCKNPAVRPETSLMMQQSFGKILGGLLWVILLRIEPLYKQFDHEIL